MPEMFIDGELTIQMGKMDTATGTVHVSAVLTRGDVVLYQWAAMKLGEHDTMSLRPLQVRVGVTLHAGS